jgi:hypothetical protein
MYFKTIGININALIHSKEIGKNYRIMNTKSQFRIKFELLLLGNNPMFNYLDFLLSDHLLFLSEWA